MRKARHAQNEEPYLTAREKEVLGLVAQNYTGQEIADRLKIKLTTVHSLRHKLYRAFRCKGTVGLLRAGVKHGALPRTLLEHG